ncbi:MAG: aldose epimerase family protein [Planctomycetia bacterium]|nr:aldose epimerase family protein [Planctomycetia bacterium]
MKKASLFIVFCILTVFCVEGIHASESSIKKEGWGKLSDGTEVDLYTLKNETGMTVQVSNYGGLIVSLTVPDKNGKSEDVVLGFDSLEDYLQEGVPYFGALIGRYGNRIANGEFKIGEQTYHVTRNENGITSLHGGKSGFDKKIWKVKELQSDEALGLLLTYTSPDGEEGFPGNLDVTVCYFIAKKSNDLLILYGAKTDKVTPINLTQHTYFNLRGAGKGTILDHVLSINAEEITPVDKNLIPTGELMKVEGTPFDFRSPTKIGERIGADHEQIKLGGGYDHNWVLNRSKEELRLAATVYDPESGRKLEVRTLEPGLQFYTGNILDGSLKGKGGISYQKHFGFCLETQHFPDSPNKEDFPCTFLSPGDLYQTATSFHFSIHK